MPFPNFRRGPRRGDLSGQNWFQRNLFRLIGTALPTPGAGTVGSFVDRRRAIARENEIYGPDRMTLPQVPGTIDPGQFTNTPINQTGYIPGINTGSPGTNFGFNYATPNTPGLPDYGQPNPNPTEQQMQSAWNQLFRPATPVARSGPRGGRTTQSAGARTALTGDAAQGFVEGAQWGSGGADAQALMERMRRGGIQR